MNFKITLNDLPDSNFKFYLEEEFKFRVFSILKQKYKYLGNICKNLDIDRRTLFSINEDIKIFQNNILPYLSHEDKIKTFNEVMKSNERN